MKSSLLKLFTIIVISIFTLPSMGQKAIEDGSKYGHGQDSINCRKNQSLYKTYYNQKNYPMALDFWRTVINECPLSSKNMYLHGVRMYKALYGQTKDKAYIDSVVYVYDMRIKNFGQEAYQEARKGMDLWGFGSEDIDILNRSYAVLDKSIKLDPYRTAPNALMIYMAATQKQFENGSLNNEEVIINYGKVSEILDKRIAANNKPADIGAKDNIDLIFKTGGAATCEGLVSLFTDKIKASPNDVNLLKQVLGLLHDAGCNDSDLYYVSAEHLYKIERSALAAYALAEMNKDKLNYDLAEKFYSEAIQMEEDKLKQSTYYIKMATIRLSKQDNKTARDYAKKAIVLNPENGAAFMIVGNSYAGQKISDDPIENQAVMWTAVDYLREAKSVDPELADKVNDVIVQCERAYPSKKDLFFLNILEEGVAYRVGGWINEKTTVRFRKE